MKKAIRRISGQSLILILLLQGAVRVAAQDPKPNIIFFYIDDLGWTDLGTYGSDFYETPAIDLLAQQGVRFTSAYQGSARCVPSRKSLFTGKYHERPGVADAGGLSLSEYTFAEALQDAGYHTFFTGKWHLGKDSSHFPDKQGFDVNKAGCAWGAPAGSPEGGGYYFSPYDCPTLDDGPEGEYLTDRLTTETLDFIDAHQASSPEQPFLACVFHYAVHTPIEAPESYVAPYREKLASMDYSRPEKEIDGPAKTNLRHDHPVYAGMIASVDESVRRVREKLDELGLSDNTIIVFSTDHGGLSTTLRSSGREIATSNYPLRTGKGWLYEGGIRSPLIVYWPGNSQAGLVSDETVLAMDIYPSLLDMAGLPAQPGQHLDGQSFTPLLKGDDWTRSGPVMWYFPFAKTGTGNPNMAALREGDWKMIHFQHQNRFELYDLSSDIGESTDLSAQQPELLAQMKQKLSDIQEQTGMPPVSQSRIDLEENDILPEYKITIAQDAYPQFSLDLLETDLEKSSVQFTVSTREENTYVHPVNLYFHYRIKGQEEWTEFLPGSGEFRHLLPGSHVSSWDHSDVEADVVDIRVRAVIDNALDPQDLGEVIKSEVRLKKKAPAQIGFFEDHWQPKNAELPAGVPAAVPRRLPETMINVELSDTLARVSPYVGGYNLNTYYGGKIYDKPELMRHIGNLNLPFFRYPGGSGSLWYFWDHKKPNLPDSVDYLTIKGETHHIANKIRWGDIPGTDYLSLENSYELREQLGTEAIHVVNYGLARYGRHKDPVAAAAHYAADWVRHDNGRTQFWEIGNEIYGSWEPTWIIDTARNLDGQPRQITGSLYAEHCLVFLDSMRAAAAEIGSTIRIGATLGFQESRSDWDREVLQVLGDQVDFYIVHKYFGNNQDAPPVELFNSIDEFYQEKAHIDGLIDQYCDSKVPLVLTEWNTRYSGSQQNVSCANGMHTILGYKAIINEGIGLSGKWNLIWGYQGGETHGLISGEKDNPSVEGIPAYFPRAPFHYLYYFKRFLGDVSVSNQSDQGLGLEVFSSAFSSGEAGIVILNTSADEQRAVVNLEDFSYGDSYHYFTLIPSEGNAYDRKTLVNGIGNEQYQGGGPLAYEDIAAYSSPSDGGIRLDLPPYSATFVLAEGSYAAQASEAIVNFRVHSQREGEAVPLPGAVVMIGNKMYLTDSYGEIQINAGHGTLDYQIMANGHDTLSASIELDRNLVLSDTLEVAKYELSLELRDAETKEALSEGSLGLGALQEELSAEGKALFSGISYGSYELVVTSKAYKERIPLEIYSDTLIRLELEKTVYDASFSIRDRFNSAPVNNAKLRVSGRDFYSDLDGQVVYSDTFGSYSISVEAPNYRPFSEELVLQNDTSISIDLARDAAHVKFKVYKGESPVNNAAVSLNGDIKLTNSIGIVNYYDLSTSVPYDYTVSHDDHGTLTGSFDLYADTLVQLDFDQVLLDLDLKVTDSWTRNPVPACHVLLDGTFRQAGEDGTVSFQTTPGTYELMVSKDRYGTYEGTFDLRKDSLMEVLLDLSSAIIRFKVLDRDGVVEGALVEMADQAKSSNSLGVAVFSNIPVGDSMTYIVSKDAYNTRRSGFMVRHDSLLEVSLFSVGIEGHPMAEAMVYPNPATDRISLKAPFAVKAIELIDLRGRSHGLSWQIMGEKATADIASLSPGMYFLSIRGERGQIRNLRVIVAMGPTQGL